MASFRAAFEVFEESNCPLYQAGEVFWLTESAFSPPLKKEACLILVREMTELLFTFLSESEEAAGTGSGEPCTQEYSCSGCHGLIKFRLSSVSENRIKEESIPLNPDKQVLLGKIIACPLFRTMSAEHLKGMMNFFREIEIAPGQVLIRKGEPNQDLYLVLSGQLSVDDGPVHITKLGAGELCGEMSYFAGNIAGATVTGISSASVVAVSGKFFNQIIEEAPSVQLFLSQLLAKRLVLANKARLHDFDSSMQGRLSEMLPSELFQILHMHQKTGVLSLVFPGRKGRVAFLEGRIVKASYSGVHGLQNQEAVFAVLAETEGSYTFRSGLSASLMKAEEIGDFNALLMEGIQRVDENSAVS